MTVLYVPGTPGTTIYAGQPTPGDFTVTTLLLANTTGSTQTANFISPMFGVPFKEGDLPSAGYPEFTLADDTPCPATVFNQGLWADGSTDHFSVLLISPASIEGSGTLSIKVKSGGSAPAASARSLDDLTAADLSVVLTGVTNLFGDWTASLNTAITDDDETVVIGDGPAGKVWRIRGDFKQSGSAHGQLVAYWYVAALQDASGYFAGIRVLCRIALPWADVVSPTPNYIDFSGVFKTGSTTIRTLEGHTTSETVGSTIRMQHFTSCTTAGTSGDWDFVQGGGSLSSDATVRVVFDKEDFIATKAVASYRRDLTPVDPTSVDYYPMGRGSMARGIGAAGERQDIGIMPSWYVRHLMNQSAVGERVVKVNALSSMGWRCMVRKASSGNIIPAIDENPTYPGCGSSEPTWRYWSSEGSGVPWPAGADTTLWTSGDVTSSHRPAAAYYAYRITGRPELLDLLLEQAAQLVLSVVAGSNTTYLTAQPQTSMRTGGFWARDPVVEGTSYKGAGILLSPNGPRVMAWVIRDIADAIAVLPNSGVYAGPREYLVDVLTNAMAAINAYNNAMPSSWRDAGLFGFQEASAKFESPWMVAFLSQSVAHAYALTGIPGCQTFAQHLANHWSTINAAMDFAAASSFALRYWDDAGVRILAADDLVFRVQNGTISFNTATQVFTVGGFNNDWLPSNGTKFCFGATGTLPFTVSRWADLYMVDCSGSTFKLSATFGGSPISITTTGSTSDFYMNIADYSPHPSYGEAETSGAGYLASIAATTAFMDSLGFTGLAGARASGAAGVAAASIDFTSEPKYAWTDYPE